MLKIGIDIGTTYSCVAINDNGKTDLLDISNGSYAFGDKFSMPTAVYIEKDGNILFGQAAHEKKKFSPERFSIEIKQLFTTETPLLTLEKEYKSRDLYSHLFEYFKDVIEKKHPDEEIEFVCIGHPVHYSLKTRAVLKEIAEDVFSSHIILTDELVASAIGYSEKESMKDGDIVLISNQGGDLFEISVIKKTSAGFIHAHEPLRLEKCSGNNFDKLIYNDIVEKISGNPDIDIKLALEDHSFTSNLLERATVIKHLLAFNSYRTEEFAIDGKTFSYTLSREDFEGMLRRSITSMCQKMERLVNASNIKKEDISRVILTGGSSRIPLIPSIVSEFFGNIYIDSNPECIVALGAANWEIDKEEETQKEEKALGEVQRLLNLSFTQISEAELLDITEKQGELYRDFRKNSTIAELYGAGLIILSRIQTTEETRRNTSGKLEKIYKRHSHNPAIARLYAGGLRNLACNQTSEHDLKETIEKQGRVYSKFPNNQEIANQYAFSLRNLSCIQETEENLKETSKKLEEIANNFPGNTEIAKHFAMSLRNLSGHQEITEELKATCEKLEKLYETFPTNLYIAEMYSKGLSKLSNQKNITNNLKDIIEKLEKLYIKFSDSIQIARDFTSRLVLLSIWQNTEAQMKPIMTRLERVLGKFPKDQEIVRDYTHGLVTLCASQHTEDKKLEIIEKIEGIYREFSNNSELCCQYAKSLVNLCEYQKESFDRERTCEKVEVLCHKFSKNQLIAEEYAKCLFKVFEKKSLLERKPVAEKLRYLNDAFPANREIKYIYDKTRVII